MKITRDTPDQLILGRRPIAKAVLLAVFALMVALFALAVPRSQGGLKLVLYLMAGGFGLITLLTLERVQMVMDGIGRTARMSRKTWRGIEVADFPIDAVKAFRLDPYVDKNTPRHLHFEVIDGETAGSYIFCVWNPLREKKAQARIDRVNAWLGRHAMAAQGGAAAHVDIPREDEAVLAAAAAAVAASAAQDLAQDMAPETAQDAAQQMAQQMAQDAPTDAAQAVIHEADTAVIREAETAARPPAMEPAEAERG